MKRFAALTVLMLGIWYVCSAQLYFPTRWQNRPRNALLYLPKQFNPEEKLPVVLNMHGFLTTSQFQFDYTQFHKTADSVRCIVLYPEGIDLRWNSGTFFFVSSTVDDVGYLGDLLDRMAVLYHADMSKVYAMGYSAGGFMSYKLACDMSNRVAAIAPNVASMVNDNLSSCVPARPMPIAAFNGLADAITPYTGIPGNFPGIDSIRHFWQIKNGCDAVPQTDTLPDKSNDGTRVVRYSYTSCNDNVQQYFYKIINGGHVWPGASNIFLDLLGKTTQDISMNTEAWRFFQDKSVPVSVQCAAPSGLQVVAAGVDSLLLSWQPVSDAAEYKVAVADDSNRVVFYTTNNLEYKVAAPAGIVQRWNVAAVCSSGYHNWNTTRILAATPTFSGNTISDKLRLFPNPASDMLMVEGWPNGNIRAKLRIVNLLGATVLQDNNWMTGQPVMIADLPAGRYELLLETEQQDYRALFVKP